MAARLAFRYLLVKVLFVINDIWIGPTLKTFTFLRRVSLGLRNVNSNKNVPLKHESGLAQSIAGKLPHVVQSKAMKLVYAREGGPRDGGLDFSVFEKLAL